LLLKLGIAMASVALLMTVAAVAITLVLREEPKRVAVARTADKKIQEPTVLYGEPHRVLPEETKPVPQVKAEKIEPQPAPQPAPDPKPVAEPAPRPKAKPEPAPEPKAEPVQETGQEPTPLPDLDTEWSKPTDQQIKAANQPRHYQLPSGAIMGLTIEAMGIYDAPVFDSYSQWAFTSGVAHQPETSLPWSDTPQRNVYLAGHRLGYSGTGSYLIFYNLDKLEPGDEILLKDSGGKRYTYRVSDTFIASPDESWVMGQIRGRDMLTLQTCTGPGYTQRLIVRADRV